MDTESEPTSTGLPPELSAFLDAFWGAVGDATATGNFYALVDYFDPDIAISDPQVYPLGRGAEGLRIQLQMKYGMLGDIRYQFSQGSHDVSVIGDVAVDQGFASEKWNRYGEEGSRGSSYLAVFRRTDDLGWRLFRLMMSTYRDLFEDPGIY